MNENKKISGNDENPNQPRQPQNIQGLLRFAMEATKSEDAPESKHTEMDPERKKFLEEALKSLTIDVIEEIEKSMNILRNQSSSEEDHIYALEVIQNFVDNIDNANDFHKIGGFSTIMPCLKSKNKDIRTGVCSLIAELSQNNPYCQQHLLELNVLPRLIELLSEDSQRVSCAAMHAISCMIRSYQPGLNAFIELGGLECILGCLQSKHEKVHVKVGFLISTLSSESPSIRDQFIGLNAVEYLSNLVQPTTDYDARIETILSAIQSLCQNSEATSRLINTGVQVRNIFHKIICSNKGKDDCEEIVEICQKLIKIFDAAEVNIETDR